VVKCIELLILVFFNLKTTIREQIVDKKNYNDNDENNNNSFCIDYFCILNHGINAYYYINN
jgi:hypothetical protein